ncbi:MAG: hypothetical protein JWN27_2829 [Candidatus Eremiobacteraeota bacterium]|nr:hypothetical protein [Candidatus Eremiobacteraeota bacterium]
MLPPTSISTCGRGAIHAAAIGECFGDVRAELFRSVDRLVDRQATDVRILVLDSASLQTEARDAVMLVSEQPTNGE